MSRLFRSALGTLRLPVATVLALALCGCIPIGVRGSTQSLMPTVLSGIESAASTIRARLAP